MSYEHTRHDLTDEDRREFLKVLGIGGVAAAGGLTLSELRDGASTAAVDDLAPIGEAVRADAGAVDAEFVAEQGAAFAEAAAAVPAVAERGVPTAEPGEAFGALADAGWPLYDHLEEAGFFASTSEHLPAFNPDFLETSTEAFVASEELAATLETVGVTERAAVDLVVPTVNEAEKLSHFHWIASGGVPADHDMAGALPPITQRVAGGVLLWLQNLDDHLYRKQILVTQEMLEKGLWDVEGMAAGFYLLVEAARAVGAESDRYADGELAAMLSTGIALQEIAQRLLPVHVHWITEEMRDPGNVEITDISI